MDVKKGYNQLGFQIEEGRKRKYDFAFYRIKDSENLLKCINHLQTMVGILSQSIPAKDYEQEWLQDYIEALENVKEISEEIYLKSAKKYKRRPSELEKITEKLKSVNKKIEELVIDAKKASP